MFEVDEPGSLQDRALLTGDNGSEGVPADEVGVYIRFDSHEEHLAFQQALTAHHLGNIAASVGNLEGQRR
ncbi:hypothetical protein [Corynebacterium comes]|nr:hypothetical protein [Corynebacterium comes]